MPHPFFLVAGIVIVIGTGILIVNEFNQYASEQEWSHRHAYASDLAKEEEEEDQEQDQEMNEIKKISHLSQTSLASSCYEKFKDDPFESRDQEACRSSSRINRPITRRRQTGKLDEPELFPLIDLTTCAEKENVEEDEKKSSEIEKSPRLALDSVSGSHTSSSLSSVLNQDHGLLPTVCTPRSRPVSPLRTSSNASSEYHAFYKTTITTTALVDREDPFSDEHERKQSQTGSSEASEDHFSRSASIEDEVFGNSTVHASTGFISRGVSPNELSSELRRSPCDLQDPIILNTMDRSELNWSPTMESIPSSNLSSPTQDWDFHSRAPEQSTSSNLPDREDHRDEIDQDGSEMIGAWTDLGSSNGSEESYEKI